MHNLWIAKDLVHAVDRSYGDSGSAETLFPGSDGVGLKHLFYPRQQDIAILHTHSVGAKARIGCPLRMTQFLTQTRKELIISCSDENIAVGRLEGLIGDDGAMSAALWLRNDASDEIVAGRIEQCR